MSRKVFLKFLLASLDIYLLILDILPEAASEFPRFSVPHSRETKFIKTDLIPPTVTQPLSKSKMSE
jgi:hypothetical protein